MFLIMAGVLVQSELNMLTIQLKDTVDSKSSCVCCLGSNFPFQALFVAVCHNLILATSQIVAWRHLIQMYKHTLF